VAWIYQAPRRRNLRPVVYTVMNLRVRDMRGIPWLADEAPSSEEGLCYMELQGPRELKWAHPDRVVRSLTEDGQMPNVPRERDSVFSATGEVVAVWL